MKTTKTSDPLDCTIDELLAGQPLQPSDGFKDRVLVAAEELIVEGKTRREFNRWLRLALPIAAILVAAVILASLFVANPAESQTQSLTAIELQEIFILEEELVGLTTIPDEDLTDIQLLDALNLLNLETKS